MAIHPDIQQQLYDLLTRSSNVAFVSSDQESNVRTGLTPGQRVTAQVLSTLPDSRVQVQIGNQKLNLNIPIEVRPGQNLEMTFISEDPRSTFAIARQGGVTPPVSLSDASRLLGLLIGSEKIVDPGLRSSLQSINDMLRRSSGEMGVLTNLLDDVLTYGPVTRDGVKASPSLPDGLENPGQRKANPDAAFLPNEKQPLTQEQARLSAFENNAFKILHQIARDSRFILIEAANNPLTPLPLMPGEEVDAVVTGTLPGGKAFVKIAGTPLEMVLPRNIDPGALLRLTFLSSQPKPLFALARTPAGVTPGVLSEAGRWLSVVEHSAGGASDQQLYVLERLNTVLKSLPVNSPAFTAIMDEAITYDNILRGKRPQPLQDLPSPAAAQAMTTGQPAIQTGSGFTLSDDMARLLQALIKGNRLALLEALNQQSSSSGFTPGQQLKGEVMASLGGGRFTVQVALATFEFMLPKGVKRGDSLNFFFISDEPRATFLMTRYGKAGESQVSNTGRWLSGLFDSSSGRVQSETAPGLVRTLLSSPPLDSSQVVSRLYQGMRDSGIFYESHLARWFSGDYPLEELLREPQGRLSNLRLPQNSAEGGGMQELMKDSPKTGSIEVMQEILKRTGGSAETDEGMLNRQMLPVVREQLESLQTGQITYRGELFPGQKMEWTVQERDPQDKQQNRDQRAWESALQFDFPALGQVRVQLNLEGNRVGISITTADTASAEALETGKNQLEEQLNAAGLLPTGIVVRHVAG